MAAADGEDWRSTLPPGSRTRIANKVTDSLVSHVPVSHTGGRVELFKVAKRIEDNIFNRARSRSDYLRRISLKMIAMESAFRDGPYASSGYSFNFPPYDEF